jgi:hypothetical protein
MDRPRLIRCLRIAWTVGCGIVCLMLIVLWARSRNAIDGIIGPLPSSGFGIMSRSGGLGLILSREAWPRDWRVYSLPPREVKLPYHTALGVVEYMATPDAYRVRFPYWCLTLISTAFATAPWMQKRFSLRTLLIATTLIAVLLATAAYLRLW